MKSSRETGSQSARVAKTLEREIFSGDFPPDSPLPSTRILAARFEVSQRVVLSALDLLEKKDILVRQERKRVYVKARSAVDGAKEILFFAFGDEIGLHSIYQAVNGMILDTDELRRYDFFSRIVSSGGPFTSNRLDRELARLDNLGFIDCALIYCFMDEESMRKCMKLPYPVIFLGEIPDSGKLPDGARMISPDSTGLLLASAKYAVEKQYREMVLAHWEEPAKHRYEQKALRTIETFLKKHSLPLRKIPIPGENIREACENLHSTLPSLTSSLSPGTLLALHGIHSVEFETGVLLPKKNFPGIDLLSLTLPEPDCRIKSIFRDYRDFQRTVVDFIENVRNPSEKYRHATINYHYKVVEEPRQKKSNQ